MGSTIQSFQFVASATYVTDGEVSTVLDESIANIICKYDYETKHMPIIYMGCKIRENLFNIMTKNIDKGSVILTVYKESKTEDNVIGKKELYFRGSFSYFMPNYIGYTEKVMKRDEVIQNNIDNSYHKCILGLYNIDIVNRNGNVENNIIKDSDMLSIVHYYTRDLSMIIEPFKDNTKINTCIIPPNLTINKLLPYLNSIHSFYETGFRYFNDFNATYLLSNEGNPVKTSEEELDTIIIRIMGHEEFQTKLFSMEIDNSKKAYVFYIDEKFAGLTVNHLRDKEINRLVGVDSFGNYTESILNIPTNENTTEKIKVDRVNIDNLEYINTIKDDIENTSVLLKIVKSTIDSSILTPNKEYIVQHHSSNSQYNGRYLLASKQEILVKQSNTFTSSTVFELRKVMNSKY